MDKLYKYLIKKDISYGFVKVKSIDANWRVDPIKDVSPALVVILILCPASKNTLKSNGTTILVFSALVAITLYCIISLLVAPSVISMLPVRSLDAFKLLKLPNILK